MRRDKLSWKAELVAELMQLIDCKNPTKDCQDRRDDVEGQFFVKLTYFMLYKTKQRENNSVFKSF